MEEKKEKYQRKKRAKDLTIMLQSHTVLLHIHRSVCCNNSYPWDPHNDESLLLLSASLRCSISFYFPCNSLGMLAGPEDFLEWAFGWRGVSLSSSKQKGPTTQKIEETTHTIQEASHWWQGWVGILLLKKPAVWGQLRLAPDLKLVQVHIDLGRQIRPRKDI